jgi:hypothetical protein
MLVPVSLEQFKVVRESMELAVRPVVCGSPSVAGVKETLDETHWVELETGRVVLKAVRHDDGDSVTHAYSADGEILAERGLKPLSLAS